MDIKFLSALWFVIPLIKKSWLGNICKEIPKSRETFVLKEMNSKEEIVYYLKNIWIQQSNNSKIEFSNKSYKEIHYFFKRNVIKKCSFIFKLSIIFRK